MNARGSRAPIFVVGTPRSGTTLTAQILGRHPDVLMPGELHYFEDIYTRRKALGDLTLLPARDRALERLTTLYGRFNQAADQARVDALLADPDRAAALRRNAVDYRSMLYSFMDMQLEAAGKSRWGNNTPKDIFYVDEILEFFPDARVLICVRDVRDFMLSYKDRWRVSDHGDRLRALYHPVLTASLWKATQKAIPRALGRLGPGRCMIVRYESLVAEPEQTVRAMCEVARMPFDPSMLEVEENNSSIPGLERGIFTTSVGRWREQLSAEEVYVAEWLNGEYLEELGYELARPKISWLRLGRLMASLPAAGVRALWANREHRGPTLPYLGRRVASLFRSPS